MAYGKAGDWYINNVEGGGSGGGGSGKEFTIATTQTLAFTPEHYDGDWFENMAGIEANWPEVLPNEIIVSWDGIDYTLPKLEGDVVYGATLDDDNWTMDFSEYPLWLNSENNYIYAETGGSRTIAIKYHTDTLYILQNGTYDVEGLNKAVALNPATAGRLTVNVVGTGDIAFAGTCIDNDKFITGNFAINSSNPRTILVPADKSGIKCMLPMNGLSSPSSVTVSTSTEGISTNIKGGVASRYITVNSYDGVTEGTITVTFS